VVTVLKKILSFFKKKPEKETIQKSFKEIYMHFQDLLSKNTKALSLMADLEEKLSGQYLFDYQYIDKIYKDLQQTVGDIVWHLNEMSGQKYSSLYKVFQKISQEIEDVIYPKIKIPVTPYVLPLKEVKKDAAPAVGHKMANLGEIKNSLGLNVPDAFVITAYAYLQFIAHNRLEKLIKERLAALPAKTNYELLKETGEYLQKKVLEASLPKEMEETIHKACEDLFANYQVSLAMRSSALAEDASFSFAGQYKSFLNILYPDIVLRYKEIVASQFTSEAIFYWKNKGLNLIQMAMSVGCIKIVDAKVSGVMFSANPEGEKDEILINAVWGLGPYAVNGPVTPDTYIVKKDTLTIKEKKVVPKDVMLTISPQGGTKEVSVPEEWRNKPCLNETQIISLAKQALLLERHFESNQDIEWAIDKEDTIYLLQTRPLHYIRKTKPTWKKIVSINDVLISQGTVASSGIGAGKVYFVNDHGLEEFPEGAVLLAKHSSPRYATVMPKAAAVITDFGSATGHMAILAREYNVPALVDTKIATKVLKPGMEITVDAYNAKVYRGIIEKIIREAEQADIFIQETPFFKRLKQMAQKIVPLLIDPKKGNFHSKFCKTYHDITRFTHEMAMKEMFSLMDTVQMEKAQIVRVKTKAPLNLYVMDLGEGLKEKGKEVYTEEDIQSIPLRALLKGMEHPDISWVRPVPKGLKQGISGFLSVMYESTLTKPEDFWDKTYAIISKEYSNFSCKLGYHYSNVESYCNPDINRNYIFFTFMGGGADIRRRQRRARFIGTVLVKLGFKVEIKADLIKAQFRKYDETITTEKLDYLGRLMGCSQQLDMSLSDEFMVDGCIEAFLNNNYRFFTGS